MRGHVYLHIGPPKTGTTSIQLAFQAYDSPGFVYLGVRQPRDHGLIEPSSLLHAYCSDSLSARTGEFEAMMSRIRQAVDRGDTVVLSEEMFLVWQDHADFWEKLGRLEAVLGEIPRTYIVTMRDPAEALPSYYQELYSKLSLGEKLSPSRFFEHPRCDCYDYDKLLSWFEERQIAVHTIDFQSVKHGRLDLRTLLGCSLPFEVDLELTQANMGKKGKSKATRVLLPLTLADFTRGRLLRNCKVVLRTWAPWLFDWVKALASSVVVRPEVEKSLHVPRDRRATLEKSFRLACDRRVAKM